MSTHVDYSNSPGATDRWVAPAGSAASLFDANGTWKWYPERDKTSHTILLDPNGVWGATTIEVAAVYQGPNDASDGYVHVISAAVNAKTRLTFSDKVKYIRFVVTNYAGVTIDGVVQSYNEFDVGKPFKVGTP